MANRHISRAIVLQTLFEWDFHDQSIPSVTETLALNADDFSGDSDPDHDYMQVMLAGVLQNQEQIDVIIEKAAPDWPLPKIANVDRNILRLGLFELIYGSKHNIPPKVAINEAIELAKEFGGDASGRFINGVLGSVYREMGEPGKNQTSSKIKNIPYDQMPIVQMVGTMVHADNDGMVMVALVHDVFGRWTLSKGKIEDGDADHATAVQRIAKDELGIDVNVGEVIGENEYIANDPELGKIRKQVTYYLSDAKYGDLKLGESDGLDDAKWFSLPDVVGLRFYKDVMPIVTKGAEIILKSD